MKNTHWSSLVTESESAAANHNITTGNRDRATLHPLTDSCILEVSGAGAEKLLQGQLTCDVSKLTDKQAAFGAICSPQGRMFALFRILKKEDRFLLRMNKTLINEFVQRIEKYRQFFKAEIQTKKNWVAFGLHLPNNAPQQWIDALPTSSNALNLGPQSAILRLPSLLSYGEIWIEKDCWIEPANELMQLLSDALQNNLFQIEDVNSWNAKMAESGIPDLSSETIDKLVPHMVNLHKIGGVSFKKGCYTGQEIVARMQYLGKLKKQVYCFTANTETSLRPESAIKDLQNSSLGSVIFCAKTHSNTVGLALLPMQLADAFGLDSSVTQRFSIDDIEVELTLRLPDYPLESPPS